MLYETREKRWCTNTGISYTRWRCGVKWRWWLKVYMVKWFLRYIHIREDICTYITKTNGILKKIIMFLSSWVSLSKSLQYECNNHSFLMLALHLLFFCGITIYIWYKISYYLTLHTCAWEILTFYMHVSFCYWSKIQTYFLPFIVSVFLRLWNMQICFL